MVVVPIIVLFRLVASLCKNHHHKIKTKVIVSRDANVDYGDLLNLIKGEMYLAQELYASNYPPQWRVQDFPWEGVLTSQETAPVSNVAAFIQKIWTCRRRRALPRNIGQCTSYCQIGNLSTESSVCENSPI